MRIRLVVHDDIDDFRDNSYEDFVDAEIRGCGAAGCLGWSELVQRTDYEIVVWTNDPGQIPHFHIRDANARGKHFDSCIRLDCADYFVHGAHRRKLNSAERKALVAFLASVSPKNKQGSTNWRRVVDEWNRNNSTRTIPVDQTMPNYRTLPTKK